MKTNPTRAREQGAVLVIGLIVLALITVMVAAAFKFSTYNLKAVGNMQSRNEAVAAANQALEQTIGSWDFSSAPNADEIAVDIDRNGSMDYTVVIQTPTCVKATAVRGAGDAGGDCIVTEEGLRTCPSATASADYNAVWELDATATSASSGTKVRIRQGISKPLSQNQCDAYCAPALNQPCV